MAVKLSVHGAPTDAIEDWFETDPTPYLTEEGRALVEEIRAFVRAQDYAPLSDEAARDMEERMQLAAGYASDEGVYGTPLSGAFHRVLVDERVPGALFSRIVAWAIPRMAAGRDKGGLERP